MQAAECIAVISNGLKGRPAAAGLAHDRINRSVDESLLLDLDVQSSRR